MAQQKKKKAAEKTVVEEKALLDDLFDKEDMEYLDRIHSNIQITEVISGGALGADRGGEEWARSKGIPVRVFRAEWGKYGFAAGPMRNREMAKYADAVVLFPVGRGTTNMKKMAEQYGLVVFVTRSTTIGGRTK